MGGDRAGQKIKGVSQVKAETCPCEHSERSELVSVSVPRASRGALGWP